MNPDVAAAGKEIAGWVAIIVAAAITAAVGAWRARGRREQHVPVYTGPPDEHPRKITRKEWHEHVRLVNDHGIKLVTHESRLETIARESAILQGQSTAFSLLVTRASESLARLEERFGAHVDRWEEGSERAQRDREEMMRRFDSLDRKLDRSES